jgi:hypothetical protein
MQGLLDHVDVGDGDGVVPARHRQVPRPGNDIDNPTTNDTSLDADDQDAPAVGAGQGIDGGVGQGRGRLGAHGVDQRPLSLGSG